MGWTEYEINAYLNPLLTFKFLYILQMVLYQRFYTVSFILNL